MPADWYEAPYRTVEGSQRKAVY